MPGTICISGGFYSTAKVCGQSTAGHFPFGRFAVRLWTGAFGAFVARLPVGLPGADFALTVVIPEDCGAFGAFMARFVFAMT